MRAGADWLSWSPDGRRLAAALADGSARVWDAATGAAAFSLAGLDLYPLPGRRVESPEQVRTLGDCLQWGLGGRLAVRTVGGTVSVREAAGGKEIFVAGPGQQSPSSGVEPQAVVSPSPDGTWLATSSTRGTVKVWQAATGLKTHTLQPVRGRKPPGDGGPDTLENTFVLAWSPDGKRLAGASRVAGTIQVWDMATGKVLATLPGHSGVVRALAWSGDGTRLASAGEDARVKVWDTAGAKELLSFDYVFRQAPNARPGELRGMGLLAWSPDGKRLVMAGAEERVRVWDTSGGDTMTLYGHSDVVDSVAWSPDGKRLASASRDGTVRLWDAGTGQEVFRLRPPGRSPDQSGALAWSPDGWKLALSGSGKVTIWDARPEE
jgi:WD40 repeat protein